MTMQEMIESGDQPFLSLDISFSNLSIFWMILGAGLLLFVIALFLLFFDVEGFPIPLAVIGVILIVISGLTLLFSINIDNGDTDDKPKEESNVKRIETDRTNDT